ncbi:MAG TPA: site-specific integrase [Bacteroidia bacterium]|nr:site-specific integrase [Bacteroidia bacterium]HRS60003.1 site-specific integrase [Bacteroidia bacterium]
MNFKTGLDNELKEIHHQETQPEKTEHITLIEYLEKYINNVKFVFDPKYNIRPINDRTKNKYRTLLNFLVEFIEYQRIKTLKFDDIDLEFYQDFISFLQSEKRHSTNTIGKYIATLKAILNRATEEGINTCIKYKSKKFNSPREEVDKIYLSQSEIDKIYNLKFASAQTGLERARDLFLIGCNTALRFSDFTAIQPENIIKNDSGIFLKMTTYKTSQNVTIPLNPMVVSILEKYNYQLPKNISNQKMNDHLKVIGKMAGINDIISITKTIAGKSVTQQYKKYELISCHTARRTGATLMYLSGIPVLSIMMITGHKTEKVFRGYIRIDSEQNANLIKDNPFFKRIPGGMENSHLSIAN